MPDYGVTPRGVNIKRFDVILEELHGDLSDGWGVNTRLNPKSFLNVELTSYADKLAGLWELGEQIYHSTYPFSAEGAALDSAAQFGGSSREEARPTYYPLHCECVDGTAIPKGTLVKSGTNPAISFVASAEATVTRAAFNAAKIRVAAIEPNEVYTVALNGGLHSYTSGPNPTESEIAAGIAAAIVDSNFTVEIDGSSISIKSKDAQRSHSLTLNWNLTTESVTGIVNFASEQNGDVAVPNGSISQIATSVTGLLAVTNLVGRIPGRNRQTDAEFRKSYADKIFARSNRMLESIKSAILLNVQGVAGIAAYQNDTSAVDADGRWPHCVEIVVDGGSDYEVAQQIWDKKTDGIQTFGATEVIVPGDEGEPVTIRFNRPEYVYVWFSVTIAMSGTEPLPPTYVEMIKGIISGEMEKIEPGKPIVPQKLVDAKIYGGVPGIGHISTKTFCSTDHAETPGAYAEGMVLVTPRQRAVTEATRIEVVLGV